MTKRTLVRAKMGPAALVSLLGAAILAAGCQHARTDGPQMAGEASGAAEKTDYGPAERDGPALFGWPFFDPGQVAWRGGSTRGAPVDLAEEPTEAWERLNEPNLNAFERDRRAILALAGPYRVSFQFLETAGFRPDFKPDPPYFSWATERVDVIEDRGDFISLQHTLAMYFLDDEGTVNGPMIVKHWRQDWTYEDRDRLAFRGRGVWERERLPAQAVRGTWTQTVYQVDDAPRYEAVGRWRHGRDYAAWNSQRFWRPLPRRESDVRDDYHAMEGWHVIAITPSGWIHEQRNAKVAVSEDALGKASAYLATEYGINRYERIREPDLGAVGDYWERAGPFWAHARQAWQEAIGDRERFRLRERVEGERLHERLFDYAEGIEASGSYDSEAGLRFAREAVGAYVVGRRSGPDG